MMGCARRARSLTHAHAINTQVSQLLMAEPNPVQEAVLYDGQLREYAFNLFVAFAAE